MLRRLLALALFAAVAVQGAQAQDYGLPELGIVKSGNSRSLAARDRTNSAMVPFFTLNTATHTWSLPSTVDAGAMMVTPPGGVQQSLAGAIGGKLDKTGGSATGDLFAGGQNGAFGFSTLHGGDSNNSGYVGFFDKAGVRHGYIGFGANNIIPITSENGYYYNFNVMPRVLGFPLASTVANNAALAVVPAGLGPITREGFASSGDGGRAVYTYSASACSISGGDGGAQVPAAGGGCWLLDPMTPSIVPQVWGARGDSLGTAGNGTDDTIAFKAALAYAQSRGRKLFIPGQPNARMYRLTSTLTVANTPGVASTVFLDGDYVDVGSHSGSVLFFDHLGRGLSYVAGENRLQNVGTWRAQPAPNVVAITGTLTSGSDTITVNTTTGINLYDPVTGTGIPAGAFIKQIVNATTIRLTAAATQSGSSALSVRDFTPLAADFDIYNEADLDIRNVVMFNPTKGAYSKFGRFWINNLKGQPLSTGIGTYALLDTAKWNDIHLWPYWSASQEIVSWMVRSLISFDLRRMDNAEITNVSAIIQNVGIRLSANPASESPYQGAVNKLRMVNVDLDVLAGAALQVEPSVDPANGVATAMFTNFTTQSFNGPGSAYYPSVSLKVNGNGSILGFNGYQGSFSAGNDISIGGTGNKITFSGQTLVQNWGMQNNTFPAVSVSAGNLVRFSPFPLFDNSLNGAAPNYFGGGYYTVANNSSNLLPFGSGKITITGQTAIGVGEYLLFGGSSKLIAQSGSSFQNVPASTDQTAALAALTAGNVTVTYNQGLGAYYIVNKSGADFTYYPELFLNRVPN